MDYEDRISAVEREAQGLVAALGAGPLDHPVPTCPGWTVTDLATHVGEFTGFWCHVLCEGTGRPKPPFDSPPAGDAIVAWYRDIADGLLGELRATPGDTAVWTWKPDDQSAAFVARRVAHELAVHRFDAEHARGHATPIEADLAADGIDEMLMIAGRSDARGQGQTIHLHGTDVPEEWLITLAAGGIGVERRHAKGDLALRGAVSDLELVLYQRPPLGPIEHFGDEGALETWYEVFTF